MNEIGTEKRGIWSRVRTKKGLLVVSLAFLLGVTATVAAVSLTPIFTQNLPGATAAAPVLTSNCEPTVGNSTTMPVDGGYIYYGCGAGAATAAFTVDVTGKDVTPTFALNGEATDLYAFSFGGIPTGDGRSSASGVVHMLTSGMAVSFSSATGYGYCVDATGSFSEISVTWSQ